jgi:hypothetical protein
VAVRRFIVAVGIVGVAACSAGGGGGDVEREATRATASAIVGGTIDTTRPDVLLLRDDTAAGFRCTATLIAPNLVITARHCVGKRAVPASSTLCKGGATDEGAQSLPNYQGDVDAPPMYFSASPSGPELARAATIYDDGSTTTCAHDVALIGLDKSITGIVPSQLRRTALGQGDALVAMGFGWTDRNATINANERMKGTTSVLALGPVVYSFKPFGDPMATSQPVAVATGELAVDGITMTGDSGGPAFDASGRLAALVSRGYSDAYYGPGTFTSIAAHLATIDAALAATGNAPVADGGIDPLPDAAAVDGSAPAPAAPAAPAAIADAGGGDAPAESTTSGCTASSDRGRHHGAALLLGLVSALALIRRRRPCPSRPWFRGAPPN